MRWDPTQYARYADERGRPFVDLVSRIGADSPRRVVDLGCGPGTLTAMLASRWPAAAVEGIDSSPDMIAAATAADVTAATAAGVTAATAADVTAAGSVAGVDFRVGDVASWAPEPDVDVIISNATLQWVPDHLPLLSSWAATLPPDGWLAFQVPGNFGSPSHVLMRELAESPRWAPLLSGVLRHADAVASPSVYAEVLADAGLAVDVWETTYLHVLSGPDPVLDWVRGTGLRPVLAALEASSGGAGVSDRVSESDEFVASYSTALREAYPAGPHGTIFPFRRIFAVAHKPV